MLLSFRSFFLAASLVSVSLALPPQNAGYKVKQSISEPNGWVKHATPSPDQPIELKIGLVQPNIHVLEQHLLEVSDPDHARYGQHLSKEEVTELSAPDSESVEVINDWLASHGIGEDSISRSPALDWVIVTIPLNVAETLLDTTYHTWKHVASGDFLVRTTSYSLPEHLHAHVDVLQPTTMFARFKAMRSTIYWPDTKKDQSAPIEEKAAPVMAAGVPVDASCNNTITIHCLQQLYNTINYKPQVPKKNSIAITGYLEEFANIADLQAFYRDQLPAAANSSFEFISVKGGLNDQNSSEAGVEANLDVQFAFGLSFPTTPTFYSTAGRPPFIPDTGTPVNTNEPYSDWLDFVLAQDKVPFVVSTSYDDDEQTVPKDFAIRVCKQFMQLGARGTSLMFSSGDGGVGDGDPDPATQQCFSNDGKNTTRFLPLFPSTCPFVTSVGGTVNVPEKAVSFSGGGFSNYFSRPDYQKDVVNKYLSTLPKGTYQGLFNPAGRALPDVAAQGLGFRVFVSGTPISVGGTSASSPTFAGIVALLNDARLKAGKSPLGFLNPLLYSKGFQGLNDITVGNNPGCGTPGFNATKGWDPVTGLGTPNFEKLKKIVLDSY